MCRHEVDFLHDVGILHDYFPLLLLVYWTRMGQHRDRKRGNYYGLQKS